MNNPQAFPGSIALDSNGDMQCSQDHGMTLRDYFAAKAIQGMLCNGFMPEQVAQSTHHAFSYTKAAYQIADAMLKEREKQV